MKPLVQIKAGSLEDFGNLIHPFLQRHLGFQSEMRDADPVQRACLARQCGRLFLSEEQVGTGEAAQQLNLPIQQRSVLHAD